MMNRLERQQATAVTLRPVERLQESEEEVVKQSHRSGVILTALERELFGSGDFSADDIDQFCDTHQLDATRCTLVEALATTFREEKERSNANADRLRTELFPERTDEPSSEEWGFALFRHRTGSDDPIGTISYSRTGPFFSLAFSSSNDFSTFIHGGRLFVPDRRNVRGAMRTDMIRFSFFGNDNIPILLMNEEVVNDAESDTEKHELQHAIQMLYWDGRNPMLQQFFRGKKGDEQYARANEKDELVERQRQLRDAIKDELLARIRSGNDPVYILNMLYAKQYSDLFPDDKGLQMWVRHVQEIIKQSVNEFRQFMPLFPTADARGVVVNQLMGAALEDFPAVLRRLKQYYAGFVARYTHEDHLPVRARDTVYPTRIQQQFALIDQERRHYLRQIGEQAVGSFMNESIDLTGQEHQLEAAASSHRNAMQPLLREFEKSFPSANQPHAWMIDVEQHQRSAIDLREVPWSTTVARSIVDVLDSFDQSRIHALHQQTLRVENRRQAVVDNAVIPELKQAIEDAIMHTAAVERLLITKRTIRLYATDTGLIVDCLLYSESNLPTEVSIRASYQFEGAPDSTFWDEDFLQS